MICEWLGKAWGNVMKNPLKINSNTPKCVPIKGKVSCTVFWPEIQSTIKNQAAIHMYLYKLTHENKQLDCC